MSAAGRSVAVYRRNFLPPSETFVRDHLTHLRRYRPTAVTTYVEPHGLSVPGVSVLLAEERRLTTRARRRLPRRLQVPQLAAEEHGLATVLAERAPAVVHAHFGTDGALAAGAADRVGVPLVVTFHGFDATVRPEHLAGSPIGRLLLQRWQDVLGGRHRIIAVSRFIRDELVRRGARPDAITVVPCGVDPEAFTPSTPDAAAPLLFVGRLVEKKGCADLLHALAGRPGLPGVDVVGDGPLRAELEALAQRLGVDARFHGTQDSAVVRKLMSECSVVVMPSRRAANGDTEGLPVTSLEAGASGRPVVGYAHSGLVDSVVDGATGVLVTEGDVAALGAALQGLLRDPGRLAEQGAAAREHVRAHFDLRATTARIEEVYDAACAR